jgi:HAMP domain-containing protein
MTKGSATLRGILTGLVCAFMLAGGSAGAQSSDEDARRHFEAGVSYFNTSEYEDALREFQRAYQLSDATKRPAILRNIAAVYERMGNLEKTVETLEQFLQQDPQTPDRATVELRINNLKEKIAQKEKPDEVVPPPPPAATTTAPPATTSAPPPPPPPAEPNYMPAYVSWGVGGTAALGAVITGVLAKKKYDDKESGCGNTPTGCTDDEVSGVKTMAWVSTALTGVAVVGAGVGTVLYLTAEPPNREQATGWAPQLNAGVAPGGGGVEARWTF